MENKSKVVCGYKKITNLNQEESPNCAILCCYNGKEFYQENGRPHEKVIRFVDLACDEAKARICEEMFDTPKDYLAKVIKMRDALNDYINHLEKNL